MLAIAGIGLVLRVLVAASTFLSLSEALTLAAARQPPANGVRLEVTGVPQPLYYLLLFLRVFGRTDITLRLPSVLAGAATTWFGFLWLREIFDRTAGLMGAILLTFAPAMVLQSARVDGVATFVLTVTVALLLLERAQNKASILSMVGFGTMLVLAVAFHLSGVWFTLAIGLFASAGLVRRLPARLARIFAISIVVASVLSVLLYTPLLGRHGGYLSWFATNNWPDAEASPFDQRTIFSYLVNQTVTVYRYFASSHSSGGFAFMLFLGSVVALLVKGLGRKPGLAQRRDLGLLLILPLAVTAGAACTGIFQYGGSPDVLFLFVPAAAGVSFLWSKAAGRPVWLSLLVGTLVVLMWYTRGSELTAVLRDQQRSLAEDAAAYVRNSAARGELIFADYQTRAMLQHYLPAAAAIPRLTENGEFLEVSSAGCRMVSPLHTRPLMVDSLDQYLVKLEDTYRLRRGDRVCVVAASDKDSLADELTFRLGATYTRLCSFGRRITVIHIPAVGNALGQLVASASRHTRRVPRTVLWPSNRLSDLEAREALGSLSGRMLSYRAAYLASAWGGERIFREFLPALVVWVLGSAEYHPNFMRYMDDCENYIANDCRFTLLKTDPDSIACLYLIESPIGDALESLAKAGANDLNRRHPTAFWPTAYFTTSAQRHARRLAARAVAYAELYDNLKGNEDLEQYLPALAFWAFGTRERHPEFMRYMDDCENYTSAGYRFTLLAVDKDSLAGVYLVESQTDSKAPNQ